MRSRSGSSRNSELRGHSKHIFDQDDDMVSLRNPAARDWFTELVMNYIPWVFVVSALFVNSTGARQEDTEK